MSVGVIKESDSAVAKRRDRFVQTKIAAWNRHALEKTTAAFDVVSVFVKWTLVAGFVGGIAGLSGSLFRLGLDFATAFRTERPELIFGLPLAGLAIVWLYRRTGEARGLGTNQILESVRTDRNIPAVLAPLIFVGTILTHFFGGSAGREGAALQLGGCLGYQTSRLFHLDAKETSLVILCGMSGVFASLFDAPLTATLFAMEVVSVGILYYSALIPCLFSALIACGVSSLFGFQPLRFPLKGIPELSFAVAIQTVFLAAACALVSVFFCSITRRTRTLALKIPGKGYLRAFAGGSLVLLATLILGTNDYNGAGLNVIAQALNGSACPDAFFWKILLTAITLGAGFKGGEIVPAFFIGATFGCWIGPLFGINASLAAAIGLIAVFCGSVNCPVASILLSLELFGSQGLVLFAIACGVSYALSGYYSLYSGQKIVYSKLKAEFININAR